MSLPKLLDFLPGESDPDLIPNSDNSHRPHSGHAYLQFDRISTRIIKRLLLRRVGGFGFPNHVIGERIVQRTNEILLEPFVNWLESAQLNQGAKHTATSSTIRDRHCSLDILSGQLTLSARQKATCWREFWVAWLKIVLFSTLPRRPRSIDLTSKRSCLLYGVGKESRIVRGTDERFVGYLATTPVTPLRDAKTIVVEASEELLSSNPKHIVYAGDPLLFTWRQYRLGPKRFLEFLVKHLALPFRLIRQASKFPEILIIARDIAFLALVERMDQDRMLSDIVYTSSSFLSQPLWLRGVRNFTFHMVHYSQAYQAFAFSEDKLRSDFPQMRWVRCTEHWVWTEGFAKYMADRDPSSKIHVVGPILWYRPSQRREKSDGIVLVAFDVPALTNAVARSWGELTNFWKAEHLKAFIDDLIRLRVELQNEFSGSVRLVLKAKRYHPEYDQDYANYVTSQYSQQQLELAPINENMFDLISSGHIAIVFPYSSPAYVALSVEVPTIYHDPTGTLMPTYEVADGIWFSSGYDELLGRCKAILAAKLNKTSQQKI